MPELCRTEIVFLYDVTDANPNGDPNDENRPRMDPDTGRAKVSDVRLKRTVRDYWHDYLGQDIFCRQIEKKDGTIQEGKDRAEDFFANIEAKVKSEAKNVLDKRNLIEKEIIKKCIDVRVFGATIPVAKIGQAGKDSSVTLTGAVQFAMGSSLHGVEPRFLKGTGAFASGQGAQQRTFREEYILPYALISFYGIVNQQAARTTGMTAEDANKLYEAIWYGTKNLITRSKIGQRPLLLILVEYSEPNAYIGRLDQLLSLHGNGKCTSLGDVRLKIDPLVAAIKKREHDVSAIHYAGDDRLTLDPDLPKAFEGSNIKVTTLGFK